MTDEHQNDRDPKWERPATHLAPQATPREDNEERPTNADQTQIPADTPPEDQLD